MYVVQPFLLMVDGYQDKQGEKNMKIALINEFSQASKNATVLNELKKWLNQWDTPSITQECVKMEMIHI